jgi:hypothetical protein
MRATDKPFNIDKKQVYEAYKAVESNGGASGVDGQTIEQFEADLKSNLYKIWNRMSLGTYFPPPVRAVSIPKKSGGQRILGVPTVADRVAQMVVKQVIEPNLDSVFLTDSYGYRPGKSALEARRPWRLVLSSGFSCCCRKLRYWKHGAVWWLHTVSRARTPTMRGWWPRWWCSGLAAF